MRINFFLILLMMLLSGSADLHAADGIEKSHEFETWLSVRVKKDFKKEVELGLELQTRLFEYQGTFAEGFINYELFKFLNLGGEVRFVFEKGGSTIYRLAPYAGIKATKKDLSVGYQFKFLSKHARHIESDFSMRHKVGIKYKVKKDWRVGTSLETTLKQRDDHFELSKFRWMINTRYRFSKMHYLSWFYGIERIIKKNGSLVQNHIVGTRYDIQW
ncbi:MAG: DUF2490 domain-containing protein [Bacteroidetes bacterium]|nr:DUF2490 domain-containing protein [Bacteroidota bacterium]